MITEAYKELASKVPVGTRAYLWEVPDLDGGVVVGLGVSGDESRARRAVEETMTQYPDRAGEGLMYGPRGAVWRCRRGSRGGIVWKESGGRRP